MVTMLRSNYVVKNKVTAVALNGVSTTCTVNLNVVKLYITTVVGVYRTACAVRLNNTIGNNKFATFVVCLNAIFKSNGVTLILLALTTIT